MEYKQWRTETLKRQRYSRLIMKLLFGVVERGTNLRKYRADDLRKQRTLLKGE